MKGFEAVIEAHEFDLINLEVDSYSDIREIVRDRYQRPIGPGQITTAINKLGIKRRSAVDKINRNTQQLERLMRSWQPIPERVGKTRNQWRGYVDAL